MATAYPEGECFFQRSALSNSQADGYHADDVIDFYSHFFVEFIWNLEAYHGSDSRAMKGVTNPRSGYLYPFLLSCSILRSWLEPVSGSVSYLRYEYVGATCLLYHERGTDSDVSQVQNCRWRLVGTLTMAFGISFLSPTGPLQITSRDVSNITSAPLEIESETEKGASAELSGLQQAYTGSSSGQPLRVSGGSW